MRRNLQLLSSTLQNNWLPSLPHCSVDHQVCSHVHSHRSDKTSGHHESNSPKVPLPRQCATSAGQSLQTDTGRAAGHTAGAKLCKPSCLHVFPLRKRERTETRGTESKAARASRLLAVPPHHSHAHTELTHGRTHGRTDARTHGPARGPRGTDCSSFQRHDTRENTTATDCTSREGQHSHSSLYLTLWT